MLGHVAELFALVTCNSN